MPPPRRRWAQCKRAAPLGGRPCTEHSDRERADAAETVEMDDVQEPVDVGHVRTAMEGLIHGGGAPSRTPAPTISPGADSTSHSDSTQPEDRVGTASAVGRALHLRRWHMHLRVVEIALGLSYGFLTPKRERQFSTKPRRGP